MHMLCRTWYGLCEDLDEKKELIVEIAEIFCIQNKNKNSHTVGSFFFAIFNPCNSYVQDFSLIVRMLTIIF